MANLQNWQGLGAGGLYGTDTAVGGGGSAGLAPVPRSTLDASRMAMGRTPEAEYPDGYLGPIRSRRDDKGKPYAVADVVLDSLKNRQNERSYQRGVHKGERIDQSDYFWPERLQPDRGLVNQSRGLKTAPAFELTPAPHLVNDGKANTSSDQPGVIDVKRAAQFSHLRPAWV